MRYVPNRFSLRSVLVFIAFCAITLAAGLEWRRLKSAQHRYESTLAAWRASLVPTGDLVTVADSLYRAESETLWITHAGATQLQIRRLKELADDVEARTQVTIYGSIEGMQQEVQIAEQLRAIAAELESANGVR